MAENAKEKQMDKNPEVNGETEELIDDVVGEETTNEELSVLQERLSKAEEKCEEYLSMAQRRQAEFDNFRKRNRSAVSEAYEDSKLETIEQFLPVLDNLQRALDISKGAESKEAEAICAGMEKVIKQFIDILNKMGVKEIDALGQPFDPLLHESRI